MIFLSHRIFSVGVAKISLIFRRIPHRGGDRGFGGEPQNFFGKEKRGMVEVSQDR